jgi:hypothetical protein
MPLKRHNFEKPSRITSNETKGHLFPTSKKYFLVCFLNVEKAKIRLSREFEEKNLSFSNLALWP